MKALLLQVRDHAKAETQEITCFAEALGDAADSLARYNLVAAPEIRWPDVEEADLLLLGGAGEHSVTREYSFTPYLNDVLETWIESERPFFGSCYGHHALARLYGATVVEDREAEEVGTFEVGLTAAGREDPLFSALPDRFPAQLGHHDRALNLPEELLELARSERCRYQALRLRGKPVYSTQFHPEITVAQMRDRLLMYRDSYLAPEVTWQALFDSLRPTPEAGRILRRFVEVYC